MKKIILILILNYVSITLFSQEISTLKKEVNIELLPYEKSLSFSHRDSLLLDSITYLISQSEKLTKTIHSLSQSAYSENAIRYSYRKYTKHLNKVSENGIFFLTHLGMKEGLFIPMTHNSNYYSDFHIKVMESFPLRLNIANEILKKGFLNECEFLYFSGIPYYFEYFNPEANEEIEKTRYYEGIGSIVALKAKEIKELMSNGDPCFTKNINLLLKYSASFRYAYKSS